ncbi:MAG: aminotransferase class V-fold PLP-dependent enzyme [Saprospiraceae bacterium]|nr:aminotransferase class V-fold PLP-dependent enzyme [Saprospiraceae bacterium]
MSDLLKKIYDQESFRQQGHRLVDLLADHLGASLSEKNQVNHYKEPNDQLDIWKSFLGQDHSSIDYFSDIINGSINLHHPKYMGHQISPPAPIAALSALVTDMMNNGMGVYEMGGPSTAIDRLIPEIIGKAIGYNYQCGGFLTSGGTLANLTCLLTARAQLKDRHIWNEGMGDKKLTLMVSEQAHYCVDRAARIMGLGDDGIIKIPVNDRYQMDVSKLEVYYNEAIDKGLEVFAVVGSACTTSTGSYDDLESIGAFAKSKGIWFHIDGAHGGAVVFSEKYRHIVNGIEQADSVIVDCHKMMMTPSVTTAVIYKEVQDSFTTFSQNANYLFEKNQDKEWFNMAKRTFECTKLMMGVKFYAIIQAHGTQAIDAFVTTLHDNARVFADLVTEHPQFELACYPESNIVCYRLIDDQLDEDALNKLNAGIRRQLLEDGEFYIVQTIIDGKVYLRNTMMNPFTEKKHMERLLETLINYSNS